MTTFMEKRWKTNREKPELLIPAKDLEVLRTAVNFGADAVYIGGEAFSLRAKARNFSPEDMRAGIAYAHELGVHVHVAANIFAHNRDLDQAAAYFTELAQMKPDAAMPYWLRIRECFPWPGSTVLRFPYISPPRQTIQTTAHSASGTRWVPPVLSVQGNSP